MKKFLVLCLSVFLAFAVTGASAEGASGLQLGMSILTSLSSSADANADADGLAQADSNVVAVLVDADGVIVDAFIDAVQAKMPFTAQGKLGAAFPDTFRTKLELGTEYGMSAVSKVGEWDAQIEALRVYLIGKTAQQVQGIGLDNNTRPTDADLTAGCTMAVGDYLKGVLAALENAQPVNASAGDRLGVGIVGSASRSADAADGNDGKCEAYNYYAAVTVDANGVITSCRLDSTQASVTFDQTGRITSDLSAAVVTKQEAGDAYGMRKVSSIGREWFEQADAFAAYAVGKTADEIEGMAVSAEGKPTDADLTASVTVPVGSFQQVVIKGVSNAK